MDGSSGLKIKLRRIALPREHGSWGILLEPLVSAIVIAPSLGGAFAALFVISAFLLRQPSKVLITDLTSARMLPQTRSAGMFVAAFSVIAVASGSLALLFTDVLYLLPLTLLLPLGVFQLYKDVSGNSRDLIAELAGSAAISASAPTIVLAAGWTPLAALALWSVFVCRSVPSVIYVRERLRLEKGKSFSRNIPIALHLAGLGVVALFAFNGLITLLVLPVFVFLSIRSVSGLSSRRKQLKAMQIGIWETIYGVTLFTSVVAGRFVGI
ncbi:MAG: hypothetical protein DWQ47_08655 [Acidobacteria bacterium]|nr:MAG: hypothetical protein DWQ32_16755 [Acidobacteriota bacterium]REJ99021.1 MAG: hypothetical protein DWQ38_13225 [Acidobacteriota bacterium]REK16258.1 MAG: hypothetical protein DWQ43_04465 [Acidobacteriota bacterium]REK43939.1 MAG: hypothetical protein DWQ47_08655 [Acidobacteriota bacterium]